MAIKFSSNNRSMHLMSEEQKRLICDYVMEYCFCAFSDSIESDMDVLRVYHELCGYNLMIFIYFPKESKLIDDMSNYLIRNYQNNCVVS